MATQSPNFILRFFGAIFFIYAGVIFIATMLITSVVAYVANLFSKNKYDVARKAYVIFRGWIGVYLILTFCRLYVKGKERLKTHKEVPLIFILNHTSLFDIIISTPFLPRSNFTIGKHSFSKIPLFGYVYKLGCILVDRKDAQSRAKSYQSLLDSLENDISVCIYPEGTRNKSKQKLLPFQNGAFRLSIQSQLPIVPVVLKNSAKIFPPTIPFYYLPHVAEIQILEPIIPSHFKNEQDLKNYCFAVMEQAIA